MAITQQRMMALIQAGTTLFDELQDIKAEVEELIPALANGTMPPAQLAAELAFIMAKVRPELPLAIGLEAQHFQRNARANERAAQREAEKRRQGGAPKRGGAKAARQLDRLEKSGLLAEGTSPSQQVVEGSRGIAVVDMGEAITDQDAQALQDNPFGNPQPEPQPDLSLSQAELEAQLAEDRKLAMEITKELDRQFHPSGWKPQAAYTAPEEP